MRSLAKIIKYHQALCAGCLVVLFGVFYVFCYWQLYHQDWTLFIQAGDKFFRPDEVPGVSIVPHSAGYDGQFYYWVARNPFPVGAIADKIDYTVRYSRIGYPLVAYLVSLGNPGWLPPVLIIINVVAFAVTAWAVGRIFNHFGQPGFWGVLVGFIPGIVFSIGRNLVEPLALATFAVGTLQWVKGRPWWGAAWFTLAILTKETVLPAILALAVFEILRQRKLSAPVIVPIAVYCIWKSFVAWLFLPYGLRHVLFSDLDPVPFSQAFAYFRTVFPPSGMTASAVLATLYWPALLAGFAGVVVWAWRFRRHPLAWIGFGLVSLVPFYSSHIWVEPFAYVRVSSEFWLGLIMLSALASARSRWMIGSGLLVVTSLVTVSLF